MKLTQRLRQARDGRPDDGPEPGTEAPESPPRGSAVAAYAAVLDGETLWLALEPTSGRIALRALPDGEVLLLPSEVPESDPRHRSVRTSLLDLPGADEATFEAGVVASPGAGPEPVWIPPLPQDTPVRTPPSRDGRLQLEVGRSETGMLLVHRRTRIPGPELQAIGLVPEGVLLTLGGVDPGATELHMATRDGESLATFPLTRDTGAGDTGRATCVLDPASLPVVAKPFVKLLVAAGQRRLPVQRRANDLVDPQAAVLLPTLFGEDPEVPLLRLRFAPNGTLTARVVQHDGTGVDDDGDDA